MNQPVQHDTAGVVHRVLARGIAAGATDLHFEPTDDGLLVRFRIDGGLVDIERLPPTIADNVVSRLKVLASLLTYRIDIPQEGSLRWHADPGDQPDHGGTDNGAVDLRVATFPTIRGERAVVRVFAAATALQTVDSLGLSTEQVAVLRDAVDRPAGMIVVTGPAGSGKSTTLYALVRHLRDHHRDRSVITLEDPVEQRIDRVTQVQINPHGDLTYERCMRSLLRQDPQVLLVGEVRDGRTAAIAIEAALTGHLILTTVHSGDPAETVVRFLEMGIPPYQLVSAVTLVCAQRLVRKVCRRCAASPHTPAGRRPGAARRCASREAASEPAPGADPEPRRGEPSPGPNNGGDACDACFGTGYAGRTVIAHIARIDEPMRRLVLAQASAAQIRDALRAQGPSLYDRAETLIDDGTTDRHEVARVLGHAPC